MFENVQFFAQLHSKLAKSANLTHTLQKIRKNSKGKKAEFFADFKFVDAGFSK
jgi:hypothetical protein